MPHHRTLSGTPSSIKSVLPRDLSIPGSGGRNWFVVSLRDPSATDPEWTGPVKTCRFLGSVEELRKNTDFSQTEGCPRARRSFVRVRFTMMGHATSHARIQHSENSFFLGLEERALLNLLRCKRPQTIYPVSRAQRAVCKGRVAAYSVLQNIQHMPLRGPCIIVKNIL